MRGVAVRGAQERRHRSRGGWARRTVVGAVAVALVPFGASVVAAGPAGAEYDPSGFDFMVDSPMGAIKSRIFRAADGNTDRVVYLLDGERAQNDMNGWELHTGIPAALAKFNINVVTPVGGESSFYADWNEPSNFFGVNPDASLLPGRDSGSAIAGWDETAGKTNTYKWETFITQNLRNALRDRLGFSDSRNGVFGLSSGGSAAVVLAAYHPDQFVYAGSLSGYLHSSAPGMREALRLAMLAAGGYNIDAMAAAGSPEWERLDAVAFAPTLIANNTRLYIAAGSAVPAQQDLSSPDAIIQGMPLEGIALANTKAFQSRLQALGYDNVTYDFPSIGVHNWGQWEQVANRLMPDIAQHIGKPLPPGAQPPGGQQPPGDGPPGGGQPPQK
ncbi:esterase family protein [Nocardia sp. NBC_01503]|uniref:alpha/beta hydrolase n=1 Tax=Nocardia sp. NBC_01503 TaxID=2975997 RepID=UPI002E7AFF5B|nr:alpha/beta hydrolase family protein [Nocardia sp. NBC_01503]WTL29332.1 esterase family protein [Nocardia sp. NBC_01503]